MNWKNKKLVTAVRIVLGLFMIFSGVSGLLMGPNADNIPESMIVPTQVFWDSGIFQLVKFFEIVAGAMLLFNFLPALAVLFVGIIMLGAITINVRLLPAYTIFPVIIALVDIYLAYVYWDKYKALFKKN